MKLARRAWLDAALDTVRFRLDTFPHLDYQPLPWIGAASAPRAEGSRTRWSVMQPLVEASGARTALDIGANVGWFTFSLAGLGIRTVAIERDPKFYRTLLYVARRRRFENVALYTQNLTEDSIALVPPADIVLFLAVWHHIVREHGLAAAERVLTEVWERAQKIMFFESGESEMPDRYGLPRMDPTPEDWLNQLLLRSCKGAEVLSLGQHRAFAPNGDQCMRTLFAVTRHA